MANVISFANASSEAKVESGFVKQLCHEATIDGNARLLPKSLLSKVEAIKAKCRTVTY